MPIVRTKRSPQLTYCAGWLATGSPRTGVPVPRLEWRHGSVQPAAGAGSRRYRCKPCAPSRLAASWPRRAGAPGRPTPPANSAASTSRAGKRYLTIASPAGLAGARPFTRAAASRTGGLSSGPQVRGPAARGGGGEERASPRVDSAPTAPRAVRGGVLQRCPGASAAKCCGKVLADAEHKEAAVNQSVANVSEAQVWAVGAALVALLIALAVIRLAAGRARRASEARLNELRLQLEQQAEELRTQQQGLVDEHAQKLEAISRRVESLDRQFGLTRTQGVLLQAAARTGKARGHLAEQDTGLAKRDLAEAEDALQRASALAPEALRPEIDEISRGLKELAQSVEARTFPVVAVETLTDRIYNLVAARLGQDETP